MTKAFKFIFIILPFSLLGQQTPLQNELKALISDADLKNASVSFYAFDIENNLPVAFHDENRALIPASTMKLLTTATAFEIFGKETRFKTSILYHGQIDTVNKVLNGNIIIKGGGDPALGSHRFQKHYGAIFQKWATEIKKLGVNSINGAIIADATIFNNQIPSTWIWGDIGNYYGAGANGLSVYENFYTISLKSASEVGGKVEINSVTPIIPNLDLTNHLISNGVEKDLAYIYGGPNQFNRFISGSIPKNRNEFTIKGSIPNPELLAAFLLNNKLNEIGVKTKNEFLSANMEDSLYNFKEAKEITYIESPTLFELIKLTNLHSINLYAEHLINHIGLKQNGFGSTISGTEAVRSFWNKKGIDVEGMILFDGSGLSRFNSLTSKQLVDVLIYMYQKSTNKTDFYNTLSVAGKSGTLINIGKNSAAEGNIYAKSGYMNRVRSYAGYTKTKSGRTIAFAVIVNNYNCSAAAMKIKLEKIMIRMSESI